jgi:hypothetical protein
MPATVACYVGHTRCINGRSCIHVHDVYPPFVVTADVHSFFRPNEKASRRTGPRDPQRCTHRRPASRASERANERASERASASSARLSKLFIAVLRPLYSKRRLECTPLGKVRAASVSRARAHTHTHIARGLSFMITRAARKYATEQPRHVHVPTQPPPPLPDGASVRLIRTHLPGSSNSGSSVPEEVRRAVV